MPTPDRFLGSAAGLSAPVINKLTKQSKPKPHAFAGRDLCGMDHVGLIADLDQILATLTAMHSGPTTCEGSAYAPRPRSLRVSGTDLWSTSEVRG